jgi:hypothetical protein
MSGQAASADPAEARIGSAQRSRTDLYPMALAMSLEPRLKAKSPRR